jgi:RNA polymerase sigma factor (sigma-70 family)
MAGALQTLRRSVGDDDAVQEGFLRVNEAWDPLTLSNPKGYWYAASRNALRDRQRRQAAERRAIQCWLGTQCQLETHSGVDEGVSWSEERLADLRSASSQLRGQRRRLIDLELQGIRNVADLAAALGITAGAARVLRHRTYRQLRALLSPGGMAA